MIVRIAAVTAALVLAATPVEAQTVPTPAAVAAEAPRPSEHFFTAGDGTKLRYLSLGDRGSTVILLHGYLGTAYANWVAPGIAEALAKNHRVVMLDQRGHGGSDKPHDPAAYGGRMATDVVDLLDHLKVKKAHIGGYSMGGNMTKVLLAQAPERFITAHLAGAGIDETDPVLLAEAQKGNVAGTDPDEAALTSRFVKGMMAEGARQDMVATKAVADAWGPWWPTVVVDLKTIDFPVLIVDGEYDNAFAKAARPRRELKDVQVVTLPKRNHITAIVDPLYLTTLVAFIDANDRP